MNRIIIILSTTLFSSYLSGQDNQVQKEIGIAFRNLNNFGLTYKTGSPTSLWSFSALVLNGIKNKRTDPEKEFTLNEIGFTVNVGKEFRKPIVSNLYMSIGVDLYFNYYRNANNTVYTTQPGMDLKSTSTSITPGLTCTIGALYNFPNNILFGATVNLLGFNYRLLKTERVTVTQVTKYEDTEIIYGFSNIYANMTLAYRFQ